MDFISSVSFTQKYINRPYYEHLPTKDIKVIGRSIYSLIKTFKHFQDIPKQIVIDSGIGKLDRFGHLKVDENAWYDLEQFLSIFVNIEHLLGKSTLYSMGRRVHESTPFPDWIRDLDTALQAINVTYHMHHSKNGELLWQEESQQALDGIGHYYFKNIKKNRILCTVDQVPYPCRFDEGLLSGIVQHYAPRAVVRHKQGSCRDNGDRICVYEIIY